MTNLRWILLFAGLAILLLLYFSGRPRKEREKSDARGHDRGHNGGRDADARGGLPSGNHPGQQAQHQQGQSQQGHTAQHQGRSMPTPSPSNRGAVSTGTHRDMGMPEPMFDPDALAADLARHPGQSQMPGRDVLMDGAPTEQSFDDRRAAAHARARVGHDRAGHDYAQDAGELTTTDLFGSIDPDDLERPGGSVDDFGSRPAPAPYGLNPPEDHSQSMGTSIGEKIEAFSARLTPKRKSRVAASAPSAQTADAADKTKIVSLHVVAPSGQIIPGQLLLNTFESRGYHHGDMDIYHSLHQGKTVFSIAKMVMPGVFDINDVSTYETPGITLFLQLPGPVQGDVAFEVLISEAHELASALGCNILDSERSTLSRQTVQHLRESVYEYMHRQKYFNKVPS